MSISSPARTGTCMWVMSRRMAKVLRDPGYLVRQIGLILVVGGAVPDLEVVAAADYGDVLRDAGVLEELRVQRHATGRVELDVVGASAEEAGQLATVGAERMHLGKKAVLEVVEALGREDRDTGVEPLRKDKSARERSPELRRNR